MLKCNIPIELVSFSILGQIPDKSISRRKEFILAHWWGGQVTIAGAAWIHGGDRSPPQDQHGCTGWRGHHRRASMGAWCGQVTTVGAAQMHGVERSPLQGRHGRWKVRQLLLTWGNREEGRHSSGFFFSCFLLIMGCSPVGHTSNLQFVFALPLSVEFLLKPSQIHLELCCLCDSKSSQADSGDVSSFLSYGFRNSDSQTISWKPTL